MKYGRNEQGLIVAEYRVAQWLGDDAEFLTDWGFAFDPSTLPTLAQFAAAVTARHARLSPPVVTPTKRELIKMAFEDNPVMLALVKTLAARFSLTPAQVLTALENNLP